MHAVASVRADFGPMLLHLEFDHDGSVICSAEKGSAKRHFRMRNLACKLDSRHMVLKGEACVAAALQVVPGSAVGVPSWT